MTFFLQWICFGVGAAVYNDIIRLNFNRLSFTLRFDQLAGGTDAGTGSHRFKFFLIQFGQINNNLNIMYGRSIIQGNKADIFVTAAGPNPAFNVYICTVISPFEGIHNFCS